MTRGNQRCRNGSGIWMTCQSHHRRLAGCPTYRALKLDLSPFIISPIYGRCAPSSLNSVQRASPRSQIERAVTRQYSRELLLVLCRFAYSYRNRLIYCSKFYLNCCYGNQRIGLQKIPYMLLRMYVWVNGGIGLRSGTPC